MEMILKKEIGERLRKLRIEKALTQKELSNRIAVDYSYIGKIERGEQLPSIKILMRFSKILSVHIGYFFQEESLMGLMEHLPDELIEIAGDKRKRIFLKLLKEIDEKDITLITEILRILKVHKRPYPESSLSPNLIRGQGLRSKRLLKVAEERRVYKKKG